MFRAWLVEDILDRIQEASQVIMQYTIITGMTWKGDRLDGARCRAKDPRTFIGTGTQLIFIMVLTTMKLWQVRMEMHLQDVPVQVSFPQHRLGMVSWRKRYQNFRMKPRSSVAKSLAL
mmetsp:Transcript_20539/g.46537  ORF Transcript_20539/g.46537 Transcript_20539/m.46537 type:complete len:118 (-) Transcript_20539:252-605(-)